MRPTQQIWKKEAVPDLHADHTPLQFVEQRWTVGRSHCEERRMTLQLLVRFPSHAHDGGEARAASLVASRANL